MTRFLIILLIAAAPALAYAAEPADKKEPEKVHPAKYRILVDLDKETVDSVRKEIEAEVREALAQRQKRLRWSKEELDRRLKEELRRYEEDLKAAEHALDQAKRAAERGDRAESERWAALSRTRLNAARELSRRLRAIEEALLELSRQNWHEQRRRERAIAEATLLKLDGLLREIDAERAAEVGERGIGIVPPHE